MEKYIPKNESYSGPDAAIIQKDTVAGHDFYTPMYLSANAHGLQQLKDSTVASPTIIFNNINQLFFTKVVVPLAERLSDEGLDALGDLDLKNDYILETEQNGIAERAVCAQAD